MKLIVCLDDNNAMAFNHRRQSKDCVLQEKIIALVGCNMLCMNMYTAKQFAVKPDNIYVGDDYLRFAGAEDYCFVETEDLTAEIDNACEVVVFRWNRRYPADLYFPIDRLQNGFQRISICEFTGNSHEKITQEVYSR